MNEIYATILKTFLIQSNIYYKYNTLIDREAFKNNKALNKLWLCLVKLKETLPKDSHSVEELLLLFKTDYPILNKDEQLLLDALVQQMQSVETVTDAEIVLGYLQSLHERKVAEKLAIAALDVSQGRLAKEDLEPLTKELFTNLLNAVQEPLYVECSIESAVAFASAPGIRWRLRALNQALGSLRKGNFGFLFARPETGKTTFLASEITNALIENPNLIVLWVNNEEPVPQIMLRCYCAALGRDKDWIIANLDEAKRLFAASIGNRLKIVDTANANKRDVERICKELNPGLIVFDQLDKITGPFGDERNDLVLKAKYQWARELSKVYGPVIGVCQAGGSAEGKRYLDMNDVDSSHTAKQGEADWVLGIGMTHNDGDEFVRYLSICKNKLPGDEDTVPEMRHARMQVGINPFIARYEG